MGERNKVAVRQRVEGPFDDGLVLDIAKEIGSQVSHHIKTMYPNAFDAVSRNMLVSVRNTVINQIMALVKINDADAIRAALKRRQDHRREINRLRRSATKDTPPDAPR